MVVGGQMARPLWWQRNATRDVEAHVKYETPEADIYENLSMEIHIHSEWLTDSDGKHETLVLHAITDHLCSWIGARIDQVRTN